MSNDPREWYYCTKHHLVEGREGCKASDRLGPYRTREDAERALELSAERTKEWDEDPVWNDDEEYGATAEDS